MRHVHRTMCGGDPGLAAAACALKNGIDAPPVLGIQAIVELIQQQPVWILHQGARQQYQPLLPVGQRQELAARQCLKAARPQRRADPPGLNPGNGAEQQIGAMQTGRDQILHTQVPTIARVLILPLASDIGHTRFGVRQVDRAPSLSKDAFRLLACPNSAWRRGPDIAAQEFEQLRLTGAIVAEQCPALTGPQLPGDIPQYPLVAPPHARAAQRYRHSHLHASLGCQIPLRSRTRPSRTNLIRCASSVRRAH